MVSIDGKLATLILKSAEGDGAKRRGGVIMRTLIAMLTAVGAASALIVGFVHFIVSGARN